MNFGLISEMSPISRDNSVETVRSETSPGDAHSGHAHGGHGHAPASFGRAFLIGTILNIGFVAIEAGYGIAANSVALLADAGHNLSDVLGLLRRAAPAPLA